MIYRQCQVADIWPLVDLAAAFHDLHRAIAPDDYVPTLDKAAAAEMFGEIAASPECLLAIADAGDGLAGYVWAQLVERPANPFSPAARFLFVQHIFVKPEWRRGKVASALLQCAARFGREKGAGELFADAVLSNGIAQATAGSFGFKATAVILRKSCLPDSKPSAIATANRRTS